MFIELLNHVPVISWVSEITFLMELEDSNEEIDPLGHFTWLK
jgi:hypothetical protein